MPYKFTRFPFFFSHFFIIAFSLNASPWFNLSPGEYLPSYDYYNALETNLSNNYYKELTAYIRSAYFLDELRHHQATRQSPESKTSPEIPIFGKKLTYLYSNLNFMINPKHRLTVDLQSHFRFNALAGKAMLEKFLAGFGNLSGFECGGCQAATAQKIIESALVSVRQFESRYASQFQMSYKTHLPQNCNKNGENEVCVDEMALIIYPLPVNLHYSD